MMSEFPGRKWKRSFNPCSVLPERDSGSTQCLRGGYPESDSGSRRLTAAGCFTTLNSNIAELI